MAVRTTTIIQVNRMLVLPSTLWSSMPRPWDIFPLSIPDWKGKKKENSHIYIKGITLQCLPVPPCTLFYDNLTFFNSEYLRLGTSVEDFKLIHWYVTYLRIFAKELQEMEDKQSALLSQYATGSGKKLL